MKITRIEPIPVSVPIDPARAIVGSRGGHTTSPFLLLEVHTDEGLIGLGEVSCTPRWSGEDQVSAAHLIDTYLEPLLIGQDPTDIARLTTLMAGGLANNPFTRAGVEIALWDILGKVANLPLYRLWGDAQREVVPTKFSVSGLEPSAAASIASWAVEQGFRAMKVKVGGDLQTDLARVRAVRQAVGPGVKLGVDANGGWPPWVALAAIEPLQQLDIAFIEQPVSWLEPGWMASVRARSPIPILADESVSTVFDAMALIRAGAADAFSIYVGKGAGLGMARRIGVVAGAAGLACTVGSNLEMGVASAAMIHLGMVLPPGSVEAFPCDILSMFLYEDMLLTEPLPVEAGCALATPRTWPGGRARSSSTREVSGRMIVDVHTHTPSHRGPVPEEEEEWNALGRPDGAVRVSCSWAEYDHAFSEAGVDISFVFNIAQLTPELDLKSFNDTTASFVADAPKKRIGFMSVHPMAPDVLDEMDRAVSELGLKGIKLGPNYQNFDPLGVEAERVLAEAERRRLPIVFHQGTSPIREAPLRYAHPLVMDEIAIRHPELRIVMAHMGHPWQADTIAVIRKHPNVYADVSALFYRPWSFWSGMRLATEWNVLHKLLLGSDWPIIKPGETIAGLRRVNNVVAGTSMPCVPEQAIEEIIQRDALEILGGRATVIVRRARYSDAPQVAELLMQLGSRPVDAAEAMRRLARARETVFVAEEDAQLLGLVAVKTDLYFGHPLPLTHLTALVTRGESRRSGVGRALVAAAMDFARENESIGIELTCGINPARAAAHEFYPSLGFQRSAYRYWLPLDPATPPPSG